MKAQTTSTTAAYSGSRRAIRRNSTTQPGRPTRPSSAARATGSQSTKPESTKNISTNSSVPSIVRWAPPDQGQALSGPERLCW